VRTSFARRARARCSAEEERDKNDGTNGIHRTNHGADRTFLDVATWFVLHHHFFHRRLAKLAGFSRCLFSARDERGTDCALGIYSMSNLQATVALDVPASFKPPCKSK